MNRQLRLFAIEASILFAETVFIVINHRTQLRTWRWSTLQCTRFNPLPLLRTNLLPCRPLLLLHHLHRQWPCKDPFLVRITLPVSENMRLEVYRNRVEGWSKSLRLLLRIVDDSTQRRANHHTLLMIHVAIRFWWLVTIRWDDELEIINNQWSI